MKSHIPNVALASILAEPAGQRNFTGFFSYLGTVHRWNLRVLRAQDEIAAFFADKKALSDMDGVIYSGRYDKAAFKTLASLAASPDIDRPRLAAFLASLEQPTAVLAVHDMRATDVIAAAKEASIPVPGKLAVLGIDNDPYVCDGASPAVSSIEPDFHAEGAAAAELLDKMMRSRAPKTAQHLFFGVKRVVIRESTPRLPLAESLIARAKEFIDKHATDGISPGDVAVHLGISRPLLDLRFRETQILILGCPRWCAARLDEEEAWKIKAKAEANTVLEAIGRQFSAVSFLTGREKRTRRP